MESVLVPQTQTPRCSSQLPWNERRKLIKSVSNEVLGYVDLRRTRIASGSAGRSIGDRAPSSIPNSSALSRTS